MAISSNLLLDGREVPIFLIPDIYGDDAVFANIKRSLVERGHKNENVCVWHDFRHEQHEYSHSDSQIPTIESLAQLIAAGIIASLESANLPDRIPVMIGAYSFGTTLAIEVINILKTQGKTVFAYMLDGIPAPQSRDYFKPGNVSATNDLIAITHLNALKSEIISDKTADEMFSEEEVKQISQKPTIEEQLRAIKAKYESFRIPVDKLIHFQRISQIVGQNLASLAEYKLDGKNRLAPDDLMVGMTPETLKKYGFVNDIGIPIPDGGWGEFYKFKSADLKDTIDHITQPPLKYTILNGTHTELPDHKHAATVAANMEYFFKNALKYHHRLKTPLAVSRRPQLEIHANPTSRFTGKSNFKPETFETSTLAIEVTPASPVHPKNAGLQRSLHHPSDEKYYSPLTLPKSDSQLSLASSQAGSPKANSGDSSLEPSPASSPKSGHKPLSRRSTPASSPRSGKTSLGTSPASPIHASLNRMLSLSNRFPLRHTPLKNVENRGAYSSHPSSPTPEFPEADFDASELAPFSPIKRRILKFEMEDTTTFAPANVEHHLQTKPRPIPQRSKQSHHHDKKDAPHHHSKSVSPPRGPGFFGSSERGGEHTKKTKIKHQSQTQSIPTHKVFKPVAPIRTSSKKKPEDLRKAPTIPYSRSPAQYY